MAIVNGIDMLQNWIEVTKSGKPSEWLQFLHQNPEVMRPYFVSALKCEFSCKQGRQEFSDIAAAALLVHLCVDAGPQAGVEQFIKHGIPKYDNPWNLWDRVAEYRSGEALMTPDHLASSLALLSFIEPGEDPERDDFAVIALPCAQELLDLGRAFKSEDLLILAIALFEISFEALSDNCDPLSRIQLHGGFAIANYELALLQNQQLRLSNCLEHYEKIAALINQSPDTDAKRRNLVRNRINVCFSKIELAKFIGDLGEMDAQITSLRHLITECEHLDPPIATFTLWRQLASALLMRGSTVVNNADSLEAITIFRVLADQGGELKHSSLEHAMLLIGQAEVLYQNSLNSRSVTILAKALELFEEVFENLDNLFVIRRIEILIRIGQFRLEYAYILMETPDLVFNSYTIGYISVLNSAETALREALQGAERIGSRVLVDIAKWSLARFYYLRAASTWDLKVALDGCLLLGDAVLAVGSAPPAGRVRGWLDIARLHKLVWQISANKSMLPRARRQAEIAVEWCAHLGDRALCSEAITELGMLLVLLGDYDAALEKLGSEADSARRIAILARTAVDRRRALGILAKASSGSALALLRLGEVERALTKAIAARAVQLSLAALLDAKEDTDQGKSRSIRSAYLHAQSNLDAAEQRYLLLSRQTEDLDRRIVEEEIASARSALEESMKGLEFLVEEAGSEGQIPSLDSIAGSLPPNGAMVVLIVTEAGCGAIMIPANCTALDSRNVLYLDNITDQWVERVISGSPWERKSSWLAHYARFHDPNARYLPHWNRALEELLPMLWDKLMGPISKRLNELGLKKGAEIVLMAPAELAALPLSAAGHRNEAGRWNCFLDQWTLSIASSAQHYVNAAQKLRANQQNRACLLCVTDPLGDIGVASNPASSFFPTEVTSELRGPVATVDSVLLQMTEATHLSFFCHGTFNRSHPEQSGLLLASEGIPPAPSILTFTDIRSLDLRRGRLAILGACETAKVSLEDYRTEYVGLPTAMMEAGVSSVIASNWLADTQSTYWLVSELVARERTGVTPAAALRAAQLALRDGEKPSEGQAEMVPLSFRQSGRMNREFADQPAIWATFSAWGA